LLQVSEYRWKSAFSGFSLEIYPHFAPCLQVSKVLEEAEEPTITPLVFAMITIRYRISTGTEVLLAGNALPPS
jgi:hypothetical protein